jgi:hypothetical protein
MNEKLTNEDARRIVLEDGRIPLWRIASALDRSGPPLAGNLTVSLLADVLEVGEPQNWPRTTRVSERDDALFRPHARIPKDDGNVYRSFLPEDLKDEDEIPLRAFVAASRNEFVRTRVFEVLWSRFRRFQDAQDAISSRFACTKLSDAEQDWPSLVRNLGRLSTLILGVNAKGRINDLVMALDAAAEQLARCSRPFSLTALADMVCNTLLAKKPTREAFTAERGDKWVEYLKGVAGRYRGDATYGHDALMVLQAWHTRWGDQQRARAVQREIVENLRDAASKVEPGVAPAVYQRALQAALDFKLSDLTEVVRTDLIGAIKGSVSTIKPISQPFTLPRELLAQADALLTTNPQLASAIRQLAVLPGLLDIDAEDLRKQAAEQLKDLPLLALMPSVQIHPEGKITHRTDDIEGNVESHVSFLMGTHLIYVEAFLRYFLSQAFERFEPRTLFDALADWPHLLPHRSSLLATASEHFARQDWIASGFIAATLYEALLRDLFRAGGYSALKMEPGGIQMDETLNSLLRSKPAQATLGARHCTLAEYVLCEPALGWNLRNEIAHGTITPEKLSPGRVLLVWLLLIRVTCFTVHPAPKTRVGDVDTNQASSGKSADGTTEETT